MKIDGRTLDHATLENIRLMAVRRVGEGEKPGDVIKSYGFQRTTIYKWLREARKKGGLERLKSRKSTGRPVRLNEKHKKQVFRWINGKDPRQYSFDFGLWTRKIIATLIEKKFHIEMSVTSVGRLLAEIGITPQKPLRRAYERDRSAIEKWKKEEFQAIRKRAKRRGAEIFFLDEAGVRSDVPVGRTWAVRGKTPEVATSGQRQSVNAISAISLSGAFWFETYTYRFNKEAFLSLLKRFMKYRKRKIILILDRHPAHIARIISEYVQSLKGKLEMFFLPGYAPELNPDEFVWNHIKNNGVSKKPLRKGESLHARVKDDLKTVQKNPSLVRSFFKADSVSYIMN